MKPDSLWYGYEATDVGTIRLVPSRPDNLLAGVLEQKKHTCRYINIQCVVLCGRNEQKMWKSALINYNIYMYKRDYSQNTW